MSQSTPPGWYPAPGDPPGTHRYWDGNAWTTGPQPIQASPAPGMGVPPMGAAGPHGYSPMGGGPTRALATPGQRILARLIDTVPFWVVSLAAQGSIAVLILVSLAGIAYEIFFTATKGATLGKQAMGIAIEMQGTGQIMNGYGPAALRWVIGLIPCSFLISLVLLFTDAKHETLNDKLGKTWVVKVK